MGEKTPLLSNADGNGYYFINGGKEGKSRAVQDADGGTYIEGLPRGSTADEFEPRMLSPKRQVVTNSEKKKGGFFANLFQREPAEKVISPKSPALVKQRKAPIKVEPKVFFANERTFLAWMHVSIILAGASIAILAYSGNSDSPGSQLYGVVMLPVAVAFIVYAMYQYVRRAYMIRNKHPGPYDDTVGPTVLGIMLMLSIVAQFAIKLYSMSF